jgi:hypothetical protein
MTPFEPFFPNAGIFSRGDKNVFELVFGIKIKINFYFLNLCFGFG